MSRLEELLTGMVQYTYPDAVVCREAGSNHYRVSFLVSDKALLADKRAALKSVREALRGRPPKPPRRLLWGRRRWVWRVR